MPSSARAKERRRRTRTRTTAASSPSAKSCARCARRTRIFSRRIPAAVNPVLRRPVRAGRARVARERRNRGHRGSRQHRVHADAAADFAFLSIAATASREGAVRGSGAGSHARDDAARRTRRATARGPVESGLQRRHVVHRAARCRAAAARRQCRKVLPRAAARTAGGRAGAGARTAMRAWRRRSKILTELTQRAERTFANIEKDSPASMTGSCAGAGAAIPAAAAPAAARGAAVIEPGNVAPTPRTVDGVDYIEGRDLTLIYEGKKCIHSRFCVTLGTEGVHRQREGAVDQSRCDGHRCAHRDRACVRVRRHSLQAQGRAARRERRRR